MSDQSNFGPAIPIQNGTSVDPPISLSINGVPVEARRGDNVLDAARRAGFEIPSLCHHEAVTPYGACRLCLVEITKGGRTKTTTSCNYEVLPNIEVKTDTPEIRRHRAMVLELILARAPEHPRIKALAASYGVTRSRFRAFETQPRPLEGCILCGLCVRVCAESMGAHALTFVGRGDRRALGTPFHDAPSSCIGCASCARVCPTDCISFKDTATKRTIWGRTFSLIQCEVCDTPLLTREHRDHALAHHVLPEGYYTTCPSCKKKALASHFAAVGG